MSDMPVCPRCEQPFERLSAQDRQVFRLADDFLWICPRCPVASNGTQFVPPVKHVFDPACECANCVSKRGKTFQYVRLIPDLPDGSAGIYTEGEGPDDAMRKHLHELALIHLGEGKGQQDLQERAEAILQARAEKRSNADPFIERLLAGADDVELSPSEMALLEAHLCQPVSFATIQQEKKATGHSPTEAALNKLKLIRDFNRGLQVQGDPDELEKPGDLAPAIPTEPAPKRSTQRGEGQAKLIAALTKHHQYADGVCSNPAPVRNNELARLAGVWPSTASAFFSDKFQGYAKYRAVCRDAGKLADSLKALNSEFSPCDLYGLRPAGEDDRDQGEDVLQSPLPPLTPTGRAVLDIIKAQPKGKGIIGKEIVKELKQKGIDLKESTLRRHTLPILIEHYGVRSVPAAGGYLIPIWRGI